MEPIIFKVICVLYVANDSYMWPICKEMFNVSQDVFSRHFNRIIFKISLIKSIKGSKCVWLIQTYTPNAYIYMLVPLPNHPWGGFVLPPSCVTNCLSPAWNTPLLSAPGLFSSFSPPFMYSFIFFLPCVFLSKRPPSVLLFLILFTHRYDAIQPH